MFSEATASYLRLNNYIKTMSRAWKKTWITGCRLDKQYHPTPSLGYWANKLSCPGPKDGAFFIPQIEWLMTFMDSVGDSLKGCLEKAPVPFDQDSNKFLTFTTNEY